MLKLMDWLLIRRIDRLLDPSVSMLKQVTFLTLVVGCRLLLVLKCSEPFGPVACRHGQSC